MDQPDDLTSIIAITICEVIRKFVSKMDFRYQTDVNKRAKKDYLILNSILCT